MNKIRQKNKRAYYWIKQLGQSGYIMNDLMDLID